MEDKNEYTVDELKQIVRFENPDSDMWNTGDEVFCPEEYHVRAEDLHEAFGKMLDEKAKLSQVMTWYKDLCYVFNEYLLPGNLFQGYWGDNQEYPENEDDVVIAAADLLGDLDIFEGEDSSDADEDVIRIIRTAYVYLDCFLRNQGKDKKDWEYPDFMKMAFIRIHSDPVQQKQDPREDIQKYRRFTDELAGKDNIGALTARLYSQYEGDSAYDQDFFGARDDAEKLFGLTKDAKFANTLGYIYYYGRCNNGVPEYDKALPYFQYGAANGYYESIYKIADMYRNGYGVWKSEETAFHMISMLYPEVLKDFVKGQDTGSLTDVALRLGSMYLHGTGVSQDTIAAVYYLLIAEYAVKRRLAAVTFFGDSVVAQSIQDCLTEARELIPAAENKGKLTSAYFEVVNRLLDDDYRITWKAKQVKKDQWEIVFQRKPKRRSEQAQRCFLVVPELYYCEFTDQVKGKVKCRKDLPHAGTADGFVTIGDKTVFYLNDEEVMTIPGFKFKWYIRKPEEKQGEAITLVGVSFRPEGRVYDYLCDLDVQVGDQVIVNGCNGETEVAVKRIRHVNTSDLILPLDRYKKIVRKA